MVSRDVARARWFCVRATGRRPPLGAHVRGFAAAMVMQALMKPLPEMIRQLERTPNADPRYVRELRATWADLQAAGHEWLEWDRALRASVDGSAEVAPAEVDPSCARDEEEVQELTPLEASRLFDVSDRRIRQLLGDGLVDGRKVGRVWLVPRSNLLAYFEATRGGAQRER